METNDQQKFVIMQEPSVQSKKDNRRGFNTIGLRSQYPDKGYNSCDENGMLCSSYPNFEHDPFKIKLAFIDDESLNAFKGEKIFNENENCYFAIVEWDPSKKTNKHLIESEAFK